MLFSAVAIFLWLSELKRVPKHSAIRPNQEWARPSCFFPSKKYKKGQPALTPVTTIRVISTVNCTLCYEHPHQKISVLGPARHLPTKAAQNRKSQRVSLSVFHCRCNSYDSCYHWLRNVSEWMVKPIYIEELFISIRRSGVP